MENGTYLCPLWPEALSCIRDKITELKHHGGHKGSVNEMGEAEFRGFRDGLPVYIYIDGGA